MERLFFILGSLSAFLAVAAGAFASHGLKTRLSSDLLNTFEIGVRYHFYHALALLVVAWACARWPNNSAIISAGWLFVIGTVIFSGSLYALAFTGQRGLGAITPIGGFAFLGGWLCLAWGAWRG
ncbi:MAG: DUF423 domain-containing protein [candidate division KSB1 bacterium]|nr:DUF423 domain-containing protein [candidate division KSB1 bacterium]MDZ7301544.1 DUF423 domain-containing protein [candidate division KSB1 bacterium]